MSTAKLRLSVCPVWAKWEKGRGGNAQLGDPFTPLDRGGNAFGVRHHGKGK